MKLRHVILNSASSRVKDRTTVSTAMKARCSLALRPDWAVLFTASKAESDVGSLASASPALRMTKWSSCETVPTLSRTSKKRKLHDRGAAAVLRVRREIRGGRDR